MTIDNMTRRGARNAAPRKPWSKKKRYAVLGGIPLAMIATTAAAAAIFGAIAGIQGGGSTAEFKAQWDSAVGVDSSAMTFTPSNDLKVTSGKLQLPTTMQFFGGESVGIEAAVKVDLGKAGYVSGIEMPGLPAGWTAELVTGCAAKVTGIQPPTLVKLKITAPATLADGASWTLGAGAGVVVSPLKDANAAAPQGVVCAPYVAP